MQQGRIVPIKLGELEIGTVEIACFQGMHSTFNFEGDIKLGNFSEFFEEANLDVQMVGWHVLDYEEYLVQFLTTDIDTQEMKSYVGIYGRDDMEKDWSIPLAKTDNPTQEFVDILLAPLF